MLRLESGLDCLKCAIFARERKPEGRKQVHEIESAYLMYMDTTKGEARYPPNPADPRQRESSLLTTYWSESTISS